MSKKHFFGLILVMLAYVTVLGCMAAPPPPPPVVAPPPAAPPPPSPPIIEYREVIREVVRETPSEILMPFTINFMRQLQQGDVDLQAIQFILFGRIALERASTNPSASLEAGGRASINVEHIRNSVTINDRLEGALLESPIDNRSGEINLTVCFDEDEKYRLTFSSKIDAPDSYFYLKYNPPDRNVSTDEKGTLVYGGETYKLRFSGERPPYLLIRISQIENDKTIPLEATGRKVEK